jgi:hypothetical protein
MSTRSYNSYCRSAGHHFKLLSENWLISPLDLCLLPSTQALDPKARKKSKCIFIGWMIIHGIKDVTRLKYDT